MKLLALAVLAFPAFAQLQTVEMRVSGLDCASCAGSVERSLKRIKGVESATFDATASRALVRLKPDNNVTLDAIRDALKGIGYKPEEARIRIRGVIEGRELKARVIAFRLAGAAPAGGERTVDGTVQPGAPEVLVVDP